MGVKLTWNFATTTTKTTCGRIGSISSRNIFYVLAIVSKMNRILIFLTAMLIVYVAHMVISERREAYSLKAHKRQLESNKVITKLTEKIEALTEMQTELEDALKKERGDVDATLKKGFSDMKKHHKARDEQDDMVTRMSAMAEEINRLEQLGSYEPFGEV